MSKISLTQNKSTRSLIRTYCRYELGLLKSEMFTNKELCRLLGLVPVSGPITNKSAFYLLKEFTISEFFEKWMYKQKSELAKKRNDVSGTTKFYNSNKWKSLRYEILSDSDGKCSCCGAGAKDGVVLHVDHIKPRSKFPELALDKSNLQVLCADCNVGKSNKYDDDWRKNSRNRKKKEKFGSDKRHEKLITNYK